MMAAPRLVPADPPVATAEVAAGTTLRFLTVLQYLAAHHWVLPAADANALLALGQALDGVMQIARLPSAPPGGSGWLVAALPDTEAVTDGYPVLTEGFSPLAAPLATEESEDLTEYTETADPEVPDAAAAEAENYYSNACAAADEGYVNTEDEEAFPEAPPRTWWRHPTELDPEVSDALLNPLYTEDWAAATTRWKGETEVLTDAETAALERHAEAKLRRLRSLPPEEYRTEEDLALTLSVAQKAYHFLLPPEAHRRRLLEFLLEDCEGTERYPRGN